MNTFVFNVQAAAVSNTRTHTRTLAAHTPTVVVRRTSFVGWTPFDGRCTVESSRILMRACQATNAKVKTCVRVRASIRTTNDDDDHDDSAAAHVQQTSFSMERARARSRRHFCQAAETSKHPRQCASAFEDHCFDHHRDRSYTCLFDADTLVYLHRRITDGDGLFTI